MSNASIKAYRKACEAAGKPLPEPVEAPDAYYTADELLRMARHHLSMYSHVPPAGPIRVGGVHPRDLIYYMAKYIEGKA